MKQSKFKQVMGEAVKNSWIYKLFKWFSKDKTKDLCSRCKKNKAEAVIKGNQQGALDLVKLMLESR